MMLFLPDTLTATYWLCLLNDKEGSMWTPNILGHLTSGRHESSIDEYTRMGIGLVCVWGE